nr:MbcA/ParS/Xre antitoxin family protein [uncultured Desulfuromonas sp.]
MKCVENQSVSSEFFDDVVRKATETFGDKETAMKWLYRESIPLGNTPPISLLNSSSGKNQILCELERIEHGIVS